jgi:TPR repeat protein
MATRDAASIIWQALVRGVARSKRKAMQWCRKAAESGHASSCFRLAGDMYMVGAYTSSLFSST